MFISFPPINSELVENQRRLEQEIEDLKYEREKEIQELKACKEKKVGLTEVFEQAKGRLDQANNVIGHFAQDLEVIQDALNKACADLSKRKDQKKMLLNELASLVQRVENMKRDVEESTKKVGEVVFVFLYFLVDTSLPRLWKIRKEKGDFLKKLKNNLPTKPQL